MTMTVFEYKFLDGTIFKLLEHGLSYNEISKLSSLHGRVISIRSYSYGVPLMKCETNARYTFTVED